MADDDEQDGPVCEGCITTLVASADVRDGYPYCSDCYDAMEEERRA